MSHALRRKAPAEPLSPLAGVLKSSRRVFVCVAAMSGIINLLMLTGSLFMIQVYDRVLGSQSVPTLLALSLIASAAFIFQGILEVVRTRIISLVAERIDEDLGPRIHAAVADLPLRLPRGAQETLQPFRDLDAIRMFVAGPGPLAMFDVPWMPIYLIVLFLLHPLLGIVTVVGTLVLIGLTYLTEITSKEPAKAAGNAASARNLAADQVQRNAEVVRAMGLLPVLSARWQKSHTAYLVAQRRATKTSALLSGTSKTFRMILQSAMLGLGAYLVIKGQMSSGAIIAGTILSGRAMAPVDQAISAWKGFIAARFAYERLKQMLALYPDASERFQLPPPNKTLVLENLVVAAPGSPVPIVKRASLALQAGQAVGLIGPSASGKTSLIRGIVGVWPSLAGRVLFDGASIDQWTPETLGPAIGYLPQDSQIFDGTIAENISRFKAGASVESVIAAATAAGFHEHVVAFADGYNSAVGHGGAHLSAGQRQRLGLARALYGDPFVVVLDEPNANLDAEGEAAVIEAIGKVRERGGIAIVVAHRPSAIAAVDMLAVMNAGSIVAFGPRDEVLNKVIKRPGNNVIPHPAAREKIANAEVIA